MNETPKIMPSAKGDASSWTPRQALMYALSMADDYDSVVIVFGNTKEATSYGITSTPNCFVRDGLLAASIGGGWHSK